MRAAERFLQYVTIYTTSAEGTGKTPSTERQLVLADKLTAELQAMGIAAERDAHGYVYARIPAARGCENAPVLGFIAHMDTAPQFSGEHVKPLLHENYDGGDVALPLCGRVIRAAEFPELAARRGKTLITASGDTLLGADDKAGVAEIMTLAERLTTGDMPHGAVCIAFTPDEEIGEGADHFDVERFGADFAYTVDGDQAGEISYENFNAATAVVEITGVSVHPGTAKNIMENAYLLAFAFNEQLPPMETPAHTEQYEGFYHLEQITGDSAAVQMTYLVRDHDAAKFAARKQTLQQAAKAVQTAHPRAEIKLTITDSYYNMAQQLTDCMHLIDNARTAGTQAGAEPVVRAIRGGTDGARLSYMGLPCPNLGTGGMNFHGPYECIAAEDLEQVTDILENIVAIYARQKE